MKQDDLQSSHLVNPAGMQNANRVQIDLPKGPPQRMPLPPSSPWKPERKIPLWVQLFVFFSCVFAIVVMLRYVFHKMNADTLVQKQKDEQAAKKAKAAELAHEGFEVMRQQRRNQFFARCRDDGNYPLLFIDKIVCVKPEAIAWVKYDGNPEQDTSGDSP